MSGHAGGVPVVWLNVTTSRSWRGPPVGVVRVEMKLEEELRKLLPTGGFRTCVWEGGQFVALPPAAIDDEPLPTGMPSTPSPSSPPASAAAGPVRSPVSRLFARLANRPTDTPAAQDAVVAPRQIAAPVAAAPRAPGPGDFLVTAGLDWDQPYPERFHALAREKGLRVVAFCYDLIPILLPHFCVEDVARKFREYFLNVTWGCEAVLCISEQTRRDYRAFCAETGAPERPAHVVLLGDQVPGAGGAIRDEVRAVAKSPFILFVSTIERRKNHQVLYRAYHLLCRAGRREALPKLVFVGMHGWGIGGLLSDIHLDPLTQGTIVQLQHVTDAELRHLYEHAEFCVYPSFYEGWGLPVAEALALGKAVLASDQGSLPEVGGDLVRYVSPWDASLWAAEIWRLVSEPAERRALQDRVRAQYRPRLWCDSARTVLNAIEQLHQGGADERMLDAGYHLHTHAGIRDGATIVSTGSEGYLMYGPYWALPPGAYTVEFFAAAARSRAAGTLAFDCVSARESVVHAAVAVEFDPAGARDDVPVARLAFQLEGAVEQFEVRCRTDARTGIALRRVAIRRAGSGTPIGPARPAPSGAGGGSAPALEGQR